MFGFDPMAAGGRSGGGSGVHAAERLHRLAEQRFLVGDVAGALRAAREAQARCRSLPGLAHALAAYEVHAAAAASRASGRNWYAVLSFGARTSLPSGGVGVSHEDIKRRYRRLCLTLHPDKNRSAAANGAFKLLQQAWGALSVRHPPAPRDAAATGVTKPRSAPTPSPRPRPPAPPTPASKPSDHSQPPSPAANNAHRDDDKRRAGAGDTSHSRPPPTHPRPREPARTRRVTRRRLTRSPALTADHRHRPPPPPTRPRTRDPARTRTRRRGARGAGGSRARRGACTAARGSRRRRCPWARGTSTARPATGTPRCACAAPPTQRSAGEEASTTTKMERDGADDDTIS
ncbi:serine/arginine repetitive matrix protein 1-like isoform X2 [Triticum aestivum]|uniref:serine/arginine repetitive matrix protein 1-like isoform X2 n=1 Tax=Triticum aestivum TaxID=4565 RepID=UPI001D02D539|nr:serine/arginine repetitive matrix protein 1-like isoform X2 [Triticum aestivum]